MSGCKTCGNRLGAENKSGYCKRHISAALAQDPVWREKQARAARMKLHADPVRLERMRDLAIKMGKLPQSIEGRRKHCIERELWKRGNAAQPKGSIARVRSGKRQSATKLSWCPPHLREDYKALVRGRIPSDEARRMIEDQHAVEMARFRRSIGAPAAVADDVIISAFDEGARVTLACLTDGPRAKAPDGPLDRVMAEAQKIFDVRVDDILSLSRSQHLMPARYAIAIALQRSGMSTTVIAHSLHREDHTSAIHWIRQGERREQRDAAFRAAIGALVEAWGEPIKRRKAA
ncbi:hypothetical protein [Novosphingobium sp. fls2-241-R2A-195]|uniref:hypothetical protein n=1 Tax=Novosphingobium sp. fls2-241-R2A-195 TaxID=3040296 RepID=UPI00254B4F33|nr:hypothetical protein [Novosphingobium sp. fls2-241-R2A-195]